MDEAERDAIVTIAAAYLSRNDTPVSAVREVIQTVAVAIRALSTAADPKREVSPRIAGHAVPKVPVADSVTPDAIISLIDGKPYKMLRRHLRLHGLSPDQYREMFALAPDYPMVAPNYAAKRSSIAMGQRLGRRPAT